MKLASALVCGAFLFSGIAFADDYNSQAQGMMNKASDMAKNELAEIRTVIKDCMKTDKSGASCSDKAMTKCQEKMSADQCTKLVSQVKQEFKIK